MVAGKASAGQTTLAHEIHARVSALFGRPVFARIDLIDDPDGAPVLLELEVIEPSLYLAKSPGASARLADAVRAS